MLKMSKINLLIFIIMLLIIFNMPIMAKAGELFSPKDFTSERNDHPYSISLKTGYFMFIRTGVWDKESYLETSPGDYNGTVYGAEIGRWVSPEWQLSLSGESYEGTGGEDLKLDIKVIPILITAKYSPHRSPFGLPYYFGLGAGAYFWEATGYVLGVDVEEHGSFDEGLQFGPHIVAGIEIPFNEYLSITIEDRYRYLVPSCFSKKLDLGGNQINAGISFKF